MRELNAKTHTLWTPLAWLNSPTGGAWAHDVLLEIDASGYWSSITPGASLAHAASINAQVLTGPLLPGLVNAHSHAFQRTFAGLAERREGGLGEHDDFWSWRDRMYRVALAITPAQLKAVATQLYIEMLRGGYTHVCEFHYLHHRPDGRAYDDPLTMTWMLIQAASEAGIGLTVLPVLYERAGFSAPALRDDQHRFATDVAWILAAQKLIDESASGTLVNSGVAIHSLRAAHPESITKLVANAIGPIHIHIAEQTGEVDECVNTTGLRPVEWLLRNHALDARWQLVHATHVAQSEIEGVSRRWPEGELDDMVASFRTLHTHYRFDACSELRLHCGYRRPRPDRRRLETLSSMARTCLGRKSSGSHCSNENIRSEGGRRSRRSNSSDNIPYQQRRTDEVQRISDKGASDNDQPS